VDGGEVKKPAPLAFYEDSLDAWLYVDYDQ
jgi:hypothetical protein